MRMPPSASTNDPLPDFLVIGAMKCATTTFHHDLVQHPDVFCGVKELNALTHESCFGEDTLEAYQFNFRDARESQVLGDVSTHYSMLPTYPGVAKKAAELIGPNLKIIYLVREPIQRCLSHHQHMMNEVSDQKMGPDVNEEIRKHPEPIAYSQYAMQLEPWIDLFGMQQIKVVKFEDYVSSRATVMAEVFEFIGVKPLIIEVENEGVNRSNDRRVAGGFVKTLWRSSLFQRVIKPLSPEFLRTTLRRVLLAKAKLASIPPTPETIELIFDQVKADVERLRELTGRVDPFWDMESVKSEFVSQVFQATSGKAKQSL